MKIIPQITDKYKASMGRSTIEDRFAVMQASWVSHIINLLYEMRERGKVDGDLAAAFDSAETFCQRGLATPPVEIKEL